MTTTTKPAFAMKPPNPGVRPWRGGLRLVWTGQPKFSDDRRRWLNYLERRALTDALGCPFDSCCLSGELWADLVRAELASLC